MNGTSTNNKIEAEASGAASVEPTAHAPYEAQVQQRQNVAEPRTPIFLPPDLQKL